MPIWSAEIKELESLFTSIKGRFPELEKELERLVKADDENMVLLYSRRCLEVIIANLCECELKRPRGTEPLKGIIDKLNHEKKVPSNIIASMEGLNTLSTFGTHPKDFDPEQVKPVLNNLKTILKWYFKFKSEKSEAEERYRVQGAGYKGHGTGDKEQSVESRDNIPAGSREYIKKSMKRLIFLISGILLVVVIVVVALFIFNVIGGNKESKEIEKSIAVLPFIDDSRNEENTAFINGLMDEILINLQTIKDLSVPGRTSVEQYRNNVTKSLPEIAKELGVNYIVEGSGQKYGNTFRLRVQLLEGAKGRHLWGETYEQKIENVEDIFSIQSQIAQSIADELKAVITPQEKELIEKVPTSSLTAYDFYQRGREEYLKNLSNVQYFAYTLGGNKMEELKRAEIFYHEALKYDPQFARAYTGLAWVYLYKNYWDTYFSKNFLDSVIILVNIALSYDDQLPEAFTLKGHYYNETGEPEQALAAYDRAIKLNPNDWEAYYRKGQLYSVNDLVKSVENYHKAGSLGFEYIWTGFTEKAKNYYREAFKLDGDSLEYLIGLGSIEFFSGNTGNSVDFYLKGYTIDTNNTLILLYLGSSYMYLEQYKISFNYYKKYLERLKIFGGSPLNYMHRIGYVYWQNGYEDEAEYCFDEQINYCNEMIELGRSLIQTLLPYYDLAAVYAFRGEKDKAYENLRIYNNQRKIEILGIVNLIRFDPLFDSIRDEPEFQQIVRDMEAKYQAEHERVRKWLEERNNGMME
jgi:TolB-like protein